MVALGSGSWCIEYCSTLAPFGRFFPPDHCAIVPVDSRGEENRSAVVPFVSLMRSASLRWWSTMSPGTGRMPSHVAAHTLTQHAALCRQPDRDRPDQPDEPRSFRARRRHRAGNRTHRPGPCQKGWILIARYGATPLVELVPEAAATRTCLLSLVRMFLPCATCRDRLATPCATCCFAPPATTFAQADAARSTHHLPFAGAHLRAWTAVFCGDALLDACRPALGAFKVD